VGNLRAADTLSNRHGYKKGRFAKAWRSSNRTFIGGRLDIGERGATYDKTIPNGRGGQGKGTPEELAGSAKLQNTQEWCTYCLRKGRVDARVGLVDIMRENLSQEGQVPGNPVADGIVRDGKKRGGPFGHNMGEGGGRAVDGCQRCRERVGAA